jgi:hypothetical protein
MAVTNNEVLGYFKCGDCGDRATVHKVKRGKGRFLYKRCECGCDQRTGAKVQTKLFNGTEWLGEAPEPPPNLIEPKVIPEPKQPAKQPKNEPKPEPETTGKTPLLLALAAGTGFMLLAMMGR